MYPADFLFTPWGFNTSKLADCDTFLKGPTAQNIKWDDSTDKKIVSRSDTNQPSFFSWEVDLYLYFFIESSEKWRTSGGKNADDLMSPATWSVIAVSGLKIFLELKYCSFLHSKYKDVTAQKCTNRRVLIVCIEVVLPLVWRNDPMLVRTSWATFRRAHATLYTVSRSLIFLVT